MLDRFNKRCAEILAPFEHGFIFECATPFKKAFAIGEIVSEAKITETDDHLLEDILSRLKKMDKWDYILYEYEDILKLSSQETWRHYEYFKTNCKATGFKLYVLMSDFKDIGLLKKEFPTLSSFLDQAGEAAFGIAWPFNYKESYVWLNREAILADAEPKERIHHEMIHAWSAIMNVDEHKSFARHDPEPLLDKLDDKQESFLKLNSLLSRKQALTDAMNYCIGQEGLEFESQVNDICDAFGYFYRKQRPSEDAVEWIQDIIKLANANIQIEPLLVLLHKLKLLGIYSETFSGYYQSKIEMFFFLHGLLKSRDKLWYLDEALKTHFEEDLMD